MGVSDGREGEPDVTPTRSRYHRLRPIPELSDALPSLLLIALIVAATDCAGVQSRPGSDIDAALANTARSDSDRERDLGEGMLDGALIVMSCHDLYVNDPADNWPGIDAGQFIDQIVASPKPSAALLIVDHQARAGTGKEDVRKLHRIEDSFAIADFKAHGLQFPGSIPVLRNSADDHTLNVFDKGIRGKTDRFMHLYRKRADFRLASRRPATRSAGRRSVSSVRP